MTTKRRPLLSPRRLLAPWIRRSARSGAVGVAFAIMLVPLLLAVGSAVDYARMVHYKAELQNAVDEAALAGASVFLDPSATTQTQAKDVAQNYFYASFAMTGDSNPSLVSVSATPNASGTINPALETNGTENAYTVTVYASATIPTTFLAILNRAKLAITASATAGNPLITPQLTFSNVSSSACDLNTAYLYQVPENAAGTGYDYSKTPTFSVATGTYGHYTQGNYYYIGSSNSTLAPAPAGQTTPTLTANQPLGFMLQNITNGNATTSNGSCGANVTGANSYDAPNGGVQQFYSSLLHADTSAGYQGAPPSQNSNYTYTSSVTTNHSGSITSVSTTLPPSSWYPSGKTISEPIASSQYNTLTTYLGDDYTTGCTSTSSSSGHGQSATTTTTYTCNTKYFTASSNSAPNCSVFIQTNVTQSYINGLNNNSTIPASAQGKCYGVNDPNSAFAAPTCAQLSALESGSGSSAIAPAAVIWWDDAGGVGQGEQYYGPASHCSSTSSGGPGYGEDCQYKNNFFAIDCNTNGGSGSGLSQVLLTQ
jgi:Flp pilus assembly protein TadG